MKNTSFPIKTSTIRFRIPAFPIKFSISAHLRPAQARCEGGCAGGADGVVRNVEMGQSAEIFFLIFLKFFI
jgi:hypothetical protein